MARIGGQSKQSNGARVRQAGSGWRLKNSNANKNPNAPCSPTVLSILSVGWVSFKLPKLVTYANPNLENISGCIATMVRPRIKDTNASIKIDVIIFFVVVK